MRQRRGDSFLLEAGDSIARFFSRGAECRAWRIGGRDMLWPGDPDVWSSVAPVLFPTCGWSRDGAIRMGETLYPMPVHGFAAHSAFDAEQTAADKISFTLRDNATTRASYPFAFSLTITYLLSSRQLAVEIAVGNEGDAPMPYACGLHPGFVWGEGSHRFAFAEPERPQVPIIAPGGLFSSRRRSVPVDGRVLELSRDLFADEALCFLDVRSRSFDFEGSDGRLHIDAPDFPHIVLWNRNAAPFLAIESWTGTGDPEGFEGELHERPSMIHLAPGARRIHRASYRWDGLRDPNPST